MRVVRGDAVWRSPPGRTGLEWRGLLSVASYAPSAWRPGVGQSSLADRVAANLDRVTQVAKCTKRPLSG